MSHALTPSQTIGPFYWGTIAKSYRAELAPPGVAGERIEVALVLHDASGLLPRGVLQSSRMWSDDEWESARASLRTRGWLAGDELTDEGRRVRDGIEAKTDQLAMAPWRALGEADCRRLRELVRPLSKAIVGSDGLRGLPTR